jgi:hypothetical protein
MAHIERRVRNGKVTYRARYRDPGGQERARVFTRRGDAQRFLTEIENRKLRGTWTNPTLGRVRFREWLQEWWATTTNLRRTTAVRDETYLRLYVLPRFGDLPLAAIAQRDVRAWVADLTSRELAPATVVKAYHLLGKVLAGAVDAGMIAQSPCRRVSLPKIEREEMRFLTPVEIARLADAIRPGYRALVLVGAYGGLRIGELAGLRRERVDLLRGTVEVAEIMTEVAGKLQVGPPKTRASRRTVGLPGPSSTRSSSILPPVVSHQTSYSLAHRAARYESQVSATAYGGRRPRRSDWTGCASTTFAIPRWPCGSRPGQAPRRSPCGRATPR